MDDRIQLPLELDHFEVVDSVLADGVLEVHRILELVEGRTRQSACQALASMPISWRDSIETVVIDMFWPLDELL